MVSLWFVSTGKFLSLRPSHCRLAPLWIDLRRISSQSYPDSNGNNRCNTRASGQGHIT